MGMSSCYKSLRKRLSSEITYLISNCLICLLALVAPAARSMPPEVSSSAVIEVSERYLVNENSTEKYRVPVDLLAFVSDVDGDFVEIDVTSQPTIGQVVATSGFDSATDTSGLVEYLVDRNLFDQRSTDPQFSFRAREGTNSVTGIVSIRSDSTLGTPNVVGAPDRAWTTRERTVLIDVLANDTNATRIHCPVSPCFQSSTGASISLGDNGRTLVYTPNVTQSATLDTFTYTPASANQVGSPTGVQVVLEPMTTVLSDTFAARPGILDGRTLDTPNNLAWRTNSGSSWTVDINGSGTIAPSNACGISQSVSAPISLQTLSGPSFYLESQVFANPAAGVSTQFLLSFSKGDGTRSSAIADSVLAAGLRLVNNQAIALVSGASGVEIQTTAELPAPPSNIWRIRFGFERLGFLSLWINDARVVNRVSLPTGANPYYTSTRVGIITTNTCTNPGTTALFVHDFAMSQGELIAPRLHVIDPFSTVGAELVHGGLSARPLPVPTGHTENTLATTEVPLVLRNHGLDVLEIRQWNAIPAEFQDYMGWQVARVPGSGSGPIRILPGAVNTDLKLVVNATLRAARPAPWLADLVLVTTDTTIGTQPGTFRATVQLPFRPGYERTPEVNIPNQPITRIVLPGETVVMMCQSYISAQAGTRQELFTDWFYNRSPNIDSGAECIPFQDDPDRRWEREELLANGNPCLSFAETDTWCAANRLHPHCEDMFYPDPFRPTPPPYLLENHFRRSYLRLQNVQTGFTWNCRARNTSSVGNGAEKWSKGITLVMLYLEIRRHPEDRVISEGAATTFAATVETTAQDVTYRWHRDGIALTDNQHYQGTSTPILRLTSASPAHGGAYHLKITGALGIGDGRRSTERVTNPAQLVVLPKNTERFVGDRFRVDSVRRPAGTALSGKRTEFGRKLWAALPTTISPNLGVGYLTNASAGRVIHGVEFPFDLRPFDASEEVRATAEFKTDKLSNIEVVLFSIAENGMRQAVATASLVPFTGVPDMWVASLNGVDMDRVTISRNRIRNPRLALSYQPSTRSLAIWLDGKQLGHTQTVPQALDVDSAGLRFTPVQTALAGQVQVGGFWVGPNGAELAGEYAVAFDSFSTNAERPDSIDLAGLYPDRGIAPWLTRAPSGMLIHNGVLSNMQANPGGGLMSGGLPLPQTEIGTISVEADFDLQHARLASIGLMNQAFGAFATSGDVYAELEPLESTVRLHIRARSRAVGSVLHTLHTTEFPARTDDRYRVRFSLRMDDNAGTMAVWVNGNMMVSDKTLPSLREFAPTLHSAGFSIVPSTGGVPAGGLKLHDFLITITPPLTPFLGPPGTSNSGP